MRVDSKGKVLKNSKDIKISLAEAKREYGRERYQANKKIKEEQRRAWLAEDRLQQPHKYTALGEVLYGRQG